ncbi:NUDIX hydrolase [Magnetospirillum sp. ME-1]|uniref:NUDIX hydrolase n=1 Tax=Magnetospirillum sp. ME-1 TaxID=1639348 RepID=UPI000A1961F8|nr:NUDIX hydrolase [Magnetospirillum sp. ME-1]
MGGEGARRRADYRRYRELVEVRPELFQRPAGGIEILLDEADIAAASKVVARRNRAKGLPPASASVGVLVEDAYILVMRDAVRFPDGSLGTHNRAMYTNSRGVGVLALYRGKVALVRIFRHAVGRSILEIPRGSVEPGDGMEETVHREVAEEIGGRVARMVHLGRSLCDTSLSDGGLDLYYAELDDVGGPQPAEGITEVVMVAPETLAGMIMSGEFEDSHGIAAFLQSRLRGLLP